MNITENIFRKQIPAGFTITTEHSGLLIRDSSIERGAGYQLKIASEPRILYAELIFENFAAPLMNYAGKELASGKEWFTALAEKHTAFSARLHKNVTEDLSRQSPENVDSWWLSFQYKLGTDIHKDTNNFADVLLCFLFILFPYKIEGAPEGNAHDVSGVRYERNRVNRALCLAFHGYNCMACGINLRDNYSGLSEEFIHVHHLNPVSAAGVHRPDPVKELVPLCPNCHSVAHVRNPPYTIQEIRNMLNK